MGRFARTLTNSAEDDLRWPPLGCERPQRRVATAGSVLKTPAAVCTMEENLPVITTDSVIWEMSVKVAGSNPTPASVPAREWENDMRQSLLRALGFTWVLTACVLIGAAAEAELLPQEPVEIGTTPQFLFDNYIIDNHWALNQPEETVRRILHPGQKYEGNPVIAEDGGYVCVLRDEETGVFRMWYQTYMGPPKPGREDWHEYVTSYAESLDGLSWKLPKLGLVEREGTKENNIVWRGVHPKWYMGGSPYLLEVPEEHRRGFRYVMFYNDVLFEDDRQALNLVGSHDGIHWDKSSVTKLTSIPSDTHNAIVYDAKRDEFVMYLRSKRTYDPFGDTNLNRGHTRRVARMTSKALWCRWDDRPQNILIPDEQDAAQGYTSFYGMPVRRHAGLYWGFLCPYRPDTFMHTEFAWSRDGIRFDRLPDRPKLIPRGPEGSWDDGMVFSGYQWIDVGDEWWLYYSGNDGPHNQTQRKAGIGLIRFRKEGFISLRGPESGGFIATRSIKWPGGNLLINARARGGELRVRVTEAGRSEGRFHGRVLPGFDYTDCIAFEGDDVAHEVVWPERSLNELAGQTIQLEFYLRSAELYTFRASGPAFRRG